MTAGPVARRALDRARLVLAVLAVLAIAPGRVALADDAPPPRPRLVVLVSVDQFRAAFLERFGARLSRHGREGFRRLAREGAWWQDCRHAHSTTTTGPGHAVLGSGTYACVSGIVGNEWWQRGEGGKPGRPVYCVGDAEATVFGAPGAAGAAKVGPANFRAESLGDAMKAGLSPAPRVVSLALKDRSAILLAGRRADAAFWVDVQAGGFVSCDRYAAWNGPGGAEARAAADARMRAFDAGVLPAFVKTWSMDPAASGAYEEAAEDARPEEGPGSTFPHEPRHRLDIAHLETTPEGNDLLLAFLDAMVPLGEPAAGEAPRGLDAQRLALAVREGATDLLCLAFSSPDYVGHRYGPYSQEAADDVVRMDATLERLLALLDRRVGKGRWWLALCADHGAQAIPEWADRLGLFAGRVSPNDVATAVAKALVARGFSASGGSDPVEAVAEAQVYLSFAGVAPESRPAVEAAARDACLALPGVLRAYTRAQLLEGAVPDDALGRGALLAFEPSRSGDVVLQLRPGWVFAGRSPPATHGQPWAADARVPLFLVGPGILPGGRLEPSCPADVAATFSALLHVTPPAGCSGRVLSEAIDLAAWRASSPLR